MIENIEVNTQNSIRIASRVGVIYVDPLEISDDRHDRTVSTAVSARTIAIQPDTVEDLGVNGIGNGLFRKYDIMI